MPETHKKAGKRFKQSELNKDRFVSVRDGQKMCIDHDTRYDLPVEAPGTNYGVYADADGQLVVLDIDDHDGGEEVETSGLAALADLPPTLETRSPHGGTHRFYCIKTDGRPIAERLNETLGRSNPVPSWGEVQAKNKYVVGPGSELDGCDKDWCDSCGSADGGLYELNADRPIESIEEDELIDALAADPDLSKEGKRESQSLQAASEGTPAESADRGGRERQTEAGHGDRDEGNGDLERWQVEALLEALPDDQHFDDWIRTGYAVYSWDSSEVGKEVFEAWSRENEKWEESESQRQVDYIWSEGEEGTGDDRGKSSVGTLVHGAREAADDPSLITGILRTTRTQRQATGGEGQRVTWEDVRRQYDDAEASSNVSKGHGRQLAQKVLEREYNWMYVLESERLWVYDADTGTYHEWGEQRIAEILSDELGSHYTTNERRQVVERICAQNQVHREAVNAKSRDAPLLCVGNGVVDLETRELSDHSPEYRFTRGLSWDYPTEENDVEAKPDRVLEFLDSVTERPEDRDTLLDHLSHGLMPGHPYRAFVVTYGPGGNGKTQVAEFFRRFVGDENAANVEIDELVNDDFATGDLPGKFINWGDDMSGDGGGKLEELSTLKKASGGSYIRANEKYEKTFNFKNESALFFSANEPPRLGENKRSIKDRLYPIRMPYVFKTDPDPDDPMQKKKVSNIARKLSEDAAVMRGILKLAVDHAADLRERRGEYSMPEGPEERWEKYTEQADPIVRFARVAFDAAGPNRLVRKDDAYAVYQSLVESWGESETSERGFKRQLPRAVDDPLETKRSRQLSTDKDEAKRVRCWNRVRWTEAAREHMPDWIEQRYAEHFDDGESQDPAPSKDTANRDPLAARDPTHGAEIVADVMALSDGEYSREQQGRLRGAENTYIGLVVPGGNERLSASLQGETVRLHPVTLRTDDDGLLEAVIDDATKVEKVAEANAEGDGDDDTDRPEQTGLDEKRPPDDAGGPTASIQRVRQTVQDAEGKEPARASEVKSQLGMRFDMDPDAADRAIDEALDRGEIYEAQTGRYRAT